MDFSTRVHEFPTIYQNTWPSQKSRSEENLESLQEGSLTVCPILNSGAFAFGAEVSGLDWSNPIPEEIVQQVSNIAILA